MYITTKKPYILRYKRESLDKQTKRIILLVFAKVRMFLHEIMLTRCDRIIRIMLDLEIPHQ